MKKFCFLLILTIPTIVFAQDKFEIGLTTSYEVGNNAQQEAHNQFNKRFMSYGVRVNFNTSHKNIKIGTGLVYDRHGYRQSDTPTFILDQLNSYCMDYLTIPFRTAFSIGDKLFLRGSLGMNFSLLVDSKIMDSNSNRIGSYAVSKTDMSVFAELGVGYNFNERFGLYTHLSFLRSLTNFHHDYFGWLKHYKRGISLTLFYKI